MKISQQSSQPNKLDTPDNFGAPISQNNLGESYSAGDSKVKPNEKNDPTIFLKAAEEEHQYLREYIRNADQKAIFFFTIFSGLLVFLYSHKASIDWIKPLASWTGLDVVALLSMLGLAFSAASFLFVVIPRLKGSIRGLIFFKAIATYKNSDEYIFDMLKSSSTDLVKIKLEHCYELSLICNTKYKKLVFGLYAGAISFAFTLLYLLTSKPL